jgi:hypothetical protein
MVNLVPVDATPDRKDAAGSNFVVAAAEEGTLPMIAGPVDDAATCHFGALFEIRPYRSHIPATKPVERNGQESLKARN